MPAEPKPFNLTKKCQGPCGRVLPVSAFTRDSSQEDGLYRWCRECKNTRGRESYDRMRTSAKRARRELPRLTPAERDEAAAIISLFMGLTKRVQRATVPALTAISKEG